MTQRNRNFLAATALLALAIALTAHFPAATAAIGDGKASITLCRTILTGSLRQITSGSCTPVTEATVTLRTGPEAGTEFPLICDNCSLYNQSSAFAGRDLTGAILRGVQFTNDSLLNANFTQAQLSGANFVNTGLAGANFTNADLSSVDFTNATGMDSAILTGALYQTTICPDGTNSDDN
ncbi:MAG TPA: pentapeptide repeat-containing protein, partial [Verrucomicrobiae bacterium]|nr:pentapeptide repeat-containing protein [Verrucomicrobiae bacterium]